MSNRHIHPIFQPLLDFISGNAPTKDGLPTWATQKVYEYDLGMMTSCYQCDKALQEGQIHWVDLTCKGQKERYCSVACVFKADGLASCDDCSEPSFDLTEVDDSDPSVGYHATLQLCPECLKRRRRS